MTNVENSTNEETDSGLLKAIRQGGYVLYFRHAKPEDNSAGSDSGLSELGKQQAKQLEALFKEQNITVQLPVLTSSANRARQTAEMAFGVQNVKVEPALYQIGVLQSERPNEAEQSVKTRLLHILESRPANGSNTVLIGHHFTFGDAFPELPYLGMVILEPAGQGKGYRFLSMIRLEQFAKWSEEHRPEQVLV
ncbi:histidine phosphatase family protein [Paenibacillus elgii]